MTGISEEFRERTGHQNISRPIRHVFQDMQYPPISRRVSVSEQRHLPVLWISGMIPAITTRKASSPKDSASY